MNVRWNYIFKHQIQGKNCILHFSKYGNGLFWRPFINAYNRLSWHTCLTNCYGLCWHLCINEYSLLWCPSLSAYMRLTWYPFINAFKIVWQLVCSPTLYSSVFIFRVKHGKKKNYLGLLDTGRWRHNILFKMLGMTHWMTQHHIPGDLNP